ncbi:MAG: C-GCAxxG-C-C family protein [Anaerolineae bacterium]
MSKIEVGRSYFDRSFNCAQSVAAAFAADFGLDAATLLRVAAAFGGGVARSGDICGAASGALMVIGLRYAAAQPDKAAKEHTYERGQEFLARFRARNGALHCRALLGYDFAIPQDRDTIRNLKLTHIVCPRLVESAIEILEEMLKA